MAYVLPRAVIVLIGWGTTYFILTALSTHLAPAVIYITGVAWVLAGIVCFGYLYKLRREMGFSALSSGRRATAAGPAPATLAPTDHACPLARALPPGR